MFSTEIAERLGVSVDTFYRRRPQLHREESIVLHRRAGLGPIDDGSLVRPVSSSPPGPGRQ
jgi:hypothetical protein